LVGKSFSKAQSKSHFSLSPRTTCTVWVTVLDAVST